MNVNKINSVAVGILLLICTAITSCQYQEIGDAEFPSGTIYLPAAARGYYLIDNLPVENTIYKFQVNSAANEFNIPLAVYRSGLDTGSSFSVDIKINNDTIENLFSEAIQRGDTALLPQGKYEIASSVQMKQGERVAPFTLKIDLDYLAANADNKEAYAIAVNISGEECESNESLSTVIILIYPRIFHPLADFTSLKGTEEKQIKFTNTSLYNVNSQWDFGDGNTSAETSPDHVYAAAGSYSVKLAVTGISGLTDEKSINVTVE
jgi:hypothetical protein